MNVSTKSEYGLRALIYLASHSGREVVPAREIAEQWKVPVKYLEQILKKLKERCCHQSGGDQWRLSSGPAGNTDHRRRNHPDSRWPALAYGLCQYL